MSDPKTPTYDRSHYSWKAPSSQASQYIIERTDPATPATTGSPTSYFDPKLTLHGSSAGDLESEPQLESEPALRRRSTFNYEHESEEYKKLLEQGDALGDPEGISTAAAEPADAAAAVRRGSISSQPFKPRAKRTQSWDYRDKRGEMQMTMMHDAGTPKEGFSET